MKFIVLFLFSLVATAQINKVKSYDLKVNGLIWSAKVEVSEFNGVRDVYLKLILKDNGIFYQNYSYLSFNEVKAINESYMELATEALKAEKSDENVQSYFMTADGTSIGYEIQSNKLSWFLYKDKIGMDSYLKLDRDRLFSIFREAEKKMIEVM